MRGEEVEGSKNGEMNGWLRCSLFKEEDEVRGNLDLVGKQSLLDAGGQAVVSACALKRIKGANAKVRERTKE